MLLCTSHVIFEEAGVGQPDTHLVASGLEDRLGDGRAALTQRPRRVQVAQDELEGGPLVQQQRQALAPLIQRLVQLHLLTTEYI